MNSDQTSYPLGSSFDETRDDRNADCSHAEEAYAKRISELFKEEHDKVVHYLVARTKSWADARDIAAQAFKQLLEIEPSTVSHLKAYVYKVARNIAIDRAKLTAIRQRLNHIASYDLARTSPSPEPALFEQQRMEALQKAIDGLPPRCRMAFVLRVWDELPHADILTRFAAMGVIINERTVRRWIAYSYDHCRRELLGAEAGSEGAAYDR